MDANMEVTAPTSDGRLRKMEKDYSKDVDEALPKCQILAKACKLDEALELLLVLEKQTRSGSDTHSTSRILVAVVQLCYELKNWDKLSEHVILLSKRRGQLKQAITKMIQEVIGYLDSTPDKETKLKLIDTLRTVTEGKIYVEIERARVTRTLAQIKEADGDIDTAASVLQELQVETFGSMERREKVEFILEQMRLSLIKGDFIRTQIICKKIHLKFFEEANTEDLKRKYYELMIKLDQHFESYLKICKHYMALQKAAQEAKDGEEEKQMLRHVVLFCLLAPYDNEQSDLMHRIKKDNQRILTSGLPTFNELLDCFITTELRRWKRISELYQRELQYSKPGEDACATTVFDPKDPDGVKRWDTLRTRLTEHNIRVIANYYSKIELPRLAELLDETTDEAEKLLSRLVTDGAINAKLDRLDGIVNFSKPLDANDVLNEWSSNIDKLLGSLNKTCHLISKEQMIHGLKKGAAVTAGTPMDA